MYICICLAYTCLVMHVMLLCSQTAVPGPGSVVTCNMQAGGGGSCLLPMSMSMSFIYPFYVLTVLYPSFIILLLVLSCHVGGFLFSFSFSFFFSYQIKDLYIEEVEVK